MIPHGPEAAKGVATLATLGTFLDWMSDPTTRTTVALIAAFGAAMWSYYLARKTERDSAARNRRVEDALANMQVSDVVVADMIARILKQMKEQEEVI